MNANEIKPVAFDLGADLCGITPVKSLSHAPKGFHPNDILPDCRSVLVFAKQLPTGFLFALSYIPYKYINRLTLMLSHKLEALVVKNIPVPSDDPSKYWKPERPYARGILSLRHYGHLDGLGILGKNILLINGKLNNMMQFFILILIYELIPDSVATYQVCEEDCQLCIRSCPQSALDMSTVNQHLYSQLSNYKNEMGFV